jgi:signal transduction histidine kinase
LRVLIVEDGAVDRLILETLLKQRGHETTHVPDGESAWELLQRETFPLMLTDLRLPGIDGLELLSRVSTLDERVRPHCVVITASQKPEDLQRALDNGAHDYMFKASGAGALGVRIAIAEQQAQLRARQARGQALQSALYRISEAAHSAGSLDDLYQGIHGVLSELMQARNFYIALKDPESGVVTFPFWRDEKEEAPPARLGGQGLTEHVLRTGKPLLADRERQRQLAEEGTAAVAAIVPDYWLGVPLRSGRECFGVIGVFSYGQGFRIGREEEDVLGFVSEQVAAAIERKRAEAALRRHERMAAMGELVAGVAHEIRNPLFGLSAMIDAFEQRAGQQGGTDVDYVTHIREQIRRLTALVEDLLEYGRPHEPRLEPVPIEALLRESVAMSQARARARGVEVALEAVGGDLKIEADRKRLVQVFLNLIDNAVHYAPPGSRVQVSASADEDTGLVRCRVRDAGPGFPMEDLGRVFEPFFTRRRGGTGLGLSIAQRVVEDHRGRIEARNARDGGAIVEVTLPASRAGETAKAGRGEGVAR